MGHVRISCGLWNDEGLPCSHAEFCMHASSKAETLLTHLSDLLVAAPPVAFVFSHLSLSLSLSVMRANRLRFSLPSIHLPFPLPFCKQ